jgi:hypothetical protein
MLVQRVLLLATRRESWTVLGDDGPVQPIERYLAYPTDVAPVGAVDGAADQAVVLGAMPAAMGPVGAGFGFLSSAGGWADADDRCLR